MAKKGINFSKWRDSNWFITMFSTMFGVIFGLFLTNAFQKRSLHNSKDKAFTQVKKELETNHNLLKTYDSILRTKYDGFSYFLKKLDKDFQILVTKDSLEHFKDITNSVFTYENYEPLNDSIFKVRGELLLYVESGLVVKDLSDIIWESYKETDFLSVTPFKCITDIESVYMVQDEVNRINSQWRDFLFDGDFIGDINKRNRFMSTWKTLLLKQEFLMGMYGIQEDTFRICTQ